MNIGMHFIWVGLEHLVMTTSECRYIVVFYVRARTLLYSPCCESLPTLFLGTFELTLNGFMERCGVVVVQKDGAIAFPRTCHVSKPAVRRSSERSCKCGALCVQSSEMDTC